jgi:hypothetical protein
VSEWFPALTRRRSVAAVQGSEWLPHGATGSRLDAYNALQRCAFRDANCLREWTESWDLAFDHVYVVKGRAVEAPYAGRFGFETCCELLRDSLLSDPGYRLVYDGPGVSVFERIGRSRAGSLSTQRLSTQRFLTPSERHR